MKVGIVFATCAATFSSLSGCSIEDETMSAAVEDADLYARVLRPPTNFSVSALDSQRVRFTWTDESIGEDHFRLEGSVNDGAFDPLAVIPANTDTFSYFATFDTNVVYAYRLFANRGSQSSAPTSPIGVAHEDAFYITTVSYTSPSYFGRVLKVSSAGIQTLASVTSTTASPFNDVSLWGAKVLVVGGFTELNGVLYSHAAVWEAEQWHKVGDGIDHFAPSRIAVVQGVPLVGTYYGPTEPSRLFRWSQSSFVESNPAGIPIFGNATTNASSATTAFFCFSFGYTLAGGLQQHIALVAANDVSNVPLSQPNVVDLSRHQRNGIAVVNDDVFIALVHNATLTDPNPDTTLIRYDGGVWHVADVSGVNRYLSSIASFNGELYGSYYDLDSTGIDSESTLAKWNGSSWIEIRKMNSSRLYETTTGLVVESYNSDSQRSSLDLWDGVSWRPIIELAPGTSATGIAAHRGWVWYRR